MVTFLPFSPVSQRTYKLMIAGKDLFACVPYHERKSKMRNGSNRFRDRYIGILLKGILRKQIFRFSRNLVDE
jgi:hypothetical protein